eukprot:747715-Hanusia_phi.AAC.2
MSTITDTVIPAPSLLDNSANTPCQDAMRRRSDSRPSSLQGFRRSSSALSGIKPRRQQYRTQLLPSSDGDLRVSKSCPAPSDTT